MTTPMSTQANLTSSQSSPLAHPTPWRIEGPLVVSTVSDWHRRLGEHLAVNPEFAIDLGGVTAVDAFGLQLLLAAQRSATACGRTLRLTDIPRVFDDACASTGIERTQFPAPPS